MTEVIAVFQVALAFALTVFWIGQLIPPFESLNEQRKTWDQFWSWQP